MVNTLKIKAKLVEKDMTQSDLARVLGVAQPTLSQKINNRRPITLDEAEKMCEVLGIEPNEFASFFFGRSVA